MCRVIDRFAFRGKGLHQCSVNSRESSDSDGWNDVDLAKKALDDNFLIYKRVVMMAASLTFVHLGCLSLVSINSWQRD